LVGTVRENVSQPLVRFQEAGRIGHFLLLRLIRVPEDRPVRRAGCESFPRHQPHSYVVDPERGAWTRPWPWRESETWGSLRHDRNNSARSCAALARGSRSARRAATPVTMAVAPEVPQVGAKPLPHPASW